MGNMHRGCTPGATEAAPGVVAAVVMVTFDRPTYLRKSIDSLLSAHARDRNFRRGFHAICLASALTSTLGQQQSLMGVLAPYRGLPSRGYVANKVPEQSAAERMTCTHQRPEGSLVSSHAVHSCTLLASSAWGRARQPWRARLWPGLCRQTFPLFISQDGSHEGVRDLSMSLWPRVGYLNNIEDAPPKTGGP